MNPLSKALDRVAGRAPAETARPSSGGGADVLGRVLSRVDGVGLVDPSSIFVGPDMIDFGLLLSNERKDRAEFGEQLRSIPVPGWLSIQRRGDEIMFAYTAWGLRGSDDHRQWEASGNEIIDLRMYPIEASRLTRSCRSVGYDLERMKSARLLSTFPVVPVSEKPDQFRKLTKQKAEELSGQVWVLELYRNESKDEGSSYDGWHPVAVWVSDDSPHALMTIGVQLAWAYESGWRTRDTWPVGN